MKIAVVGSRRMSAYGREIIGKLMAELKHEEVVTIEVSGCNREVMKWGAKKVFKGNDFEKLNEEVANYADKLIVVEGGRQSGTLLLAGKFAEKGKSVYGIVGRINEENSFAPNWLVAQGAIPVVEIERLTEILQ